MLSVERETLNKENVARYLFQQPKEHAEKRLKAISKGNTWKSIPQQLTQ